MNKALMHKSFAQQTDLMAKKVEYVSRYRVVFLTGPPLKMSLDWPSPALEKF